MNSTSYLKNALLKDKMPESWDIEVCHEGEADLHKHHTSCQKNHDHKEFIPVDTFDITHLPTDYQDRDIVKYIKLMAQLTVRLTVRYVSPNRPATVPGTDKPYPFYENRGEHVLRVGTGVIKKITEGLVTIKTATHVVFDNYEAKSTSYHLFYDNGDQPAVCNTAIELECNYTANIFNTITDESFVSVDVPYNQPLRQKIEPMFLQIYEIRKKVINRLLKSSYDRHNQPLTFIVSHPHGCSKKISIGRCVEMDDNLDDVRFLYTTPTCPGSSGAAVICLNKEAWNFKSTHSGTLKKDTNLNLGSCSYTPSTLFGHSAWSPWTWLYPDLRLPDLRWLNLDRFPPELCCNLMYYYIMTWSYLCVYIEVEYVSKQRPEFWPGSELPYPLYKERESREKRRGRGWVDKVDFYPIQTSPDKTCDCDKCRISSTPERKFAHIYILTSSSLVFDKTEGTTTTCSFHALEELNSLSSTQPVCSNVETDRSQLVFVTHDLMLTETLKLLLEQVSFLKDKIHDKLFPHPSAKPISIKIGFFDVFTIGECVRAGKHLVYTNEAEKDDFGAPVIVLGDRQFHVDVIGHTGQCPHDPKLGYSRYLNYRYT